MGIEVHCNYLLSSLRAAEHCALINKKPAGTWKTACEGLAALFCKTASLALLRTQCFPTSSNPGVLEWGFGNGGGGVVLMLIIISLCFSLMTSPNWWGWRGRVSQRGREILEHMVSPFCFFVCIFNSVRAKAAKEVYGVISAGVRLKECTCSPY